MTAEVSAWRMFKEIRVFFWEEMLEIVLLSESKSIDDRVTVAARGNFSTGEIVQFCFYHKKGVNLYSFWP
jgi:hypothetical protein